jgi:hypothetical protein
MHVENVVQDSDYTKFVSDIAGRIVEEVIEFDGF